MASRKRDDKSTYRLYGLIYSLPVTGLFFWWSCRIHAQDVKTWSSVAEETIMFVCTAVFPFFCMYMLMTSSMQPRMAAENDKFSLLKKIGAIVAIVKAIIMALAESISAVSDVLGLVHK